MTLAGTRQHRWTAAELALVRNPERSLSELVDLLPDRTAQAIRQKRKGHAAPATTARMAELGRRSGAARREHSVQLRNDVVAAVAAGATPSRTGLVSRATIALWRRTDPGFCSWLDAFYRARREQRAAAARRPRHPRRSPRRDGHKPLGERLRASLRDCDIYETARRAIGDIRPDHVRDSAISNLVLALLEGAAPDRLAAAARTAIAAARGEISRVSLDAPDRFGRTRLDRLADTATV